MRLRYLIALLGGLLLACDHTTSTKKVHRSVTQNQLPQVANDTTVPAIDLPAVAQREEGAREIHPAANFEAFQAYAPEGYFVFDTAAGNLNLDDVADVVMVLQRSAKDTLATEVDTEARPVLLLIGQGNGQYKQVARNDQLVYCADCGGMMGDPYSGITIKKGYFSIEHLGGSAWRWTRITTFKYSPTDSTWYLHRDGGDYYHSTEPEKTKRSVRTVKDFGRIEFQAFFPDATPKKDTLPSR
jgi:hypothetical protein